MRGLKYLIVILFLINLSAKAQYFQYSLNGFTADRVNPALVAADDFAQLDFIFRNQRTSQEINLISTYASAKYPIMNPKRRWSGIGISFLNDQTGSAELFNFNQASIDYAINLPLNRISNLSVGFRGSFQTKSLSLSGLTTGSQFVEYRGFDRGIPSGEQTSGLNTNYFTISTGIFWQAFNRQGDRSAYVGISLYDFNKPDISFVEDDSEKQLITTVLTGGVMLYENYKWKISPEALITHSGGTTNLMVGPVFNYKLEGTNNPQINLITRYTNSNNLIAGMVYETENLRVGASYDLSFFKNNVSNTGAFEVGLTLRNLRQLPSLKRKSKKSRKEKEKPEASARQKQQIKQNIDSTETKNQSIAKEEPKVKEDQKITKPPETTASSGKIQREPHALENVEVSFSFKFNRSALSIENEEYLSQLVELLASEPRFIVQLTGHTDNVGTSEYNLSLSKQRAETVKQFLIENGVHKNQIEVEAKGEEQPIANNATEDGRAKNRRVGLKLLYK